MQYTVFVKQVILKISGKVQGVFFRTEAKEYADELEVFGWVRNEADGSVTVCVQSQDDGSLNKLVQWCRRGPQGATVEHIEESWGEPVEPCVEFEVRY